MILSKRIALVVGFGVLWVGFPFNLAAQGVTQAAQAFGEESIPEILESFRSGKPNRAAMRCSSLETSITEEPERWPRARLDSLSEGIIEVILEKQAGESPHYLSMLGVLTLAVNLPARGHVGTFDQFVTVFDADLDHLRRELVLEEMGKVADEPRAVGFLARIVLAPQGDFRGYERTAAVSGLTFTEPGRNRLRAIHQGDSALHPDVARWMRTLAARGFRRFPGGGSE